MLWLLFSLSVAYSLRPTAQNTLVFTERSLGVLAEASPAVTCQKTDSALFQSQSGCSALSDCLVCGPLSVDVQKGTKVTYPVFLSGTCSFSSWSTSQWWSASWNESASVVQSGNKNTTWTADVGALATTGSSGTTTSTWCLDGKFVGLKTTFVATDGTTGTTSAPTTTKATTTTTAAPTTTSASTSACPQGSQVVSSNPTTSPDSSWCSGSSSCKVCQTLGSWQNQKRTVTLSLACPVTSSVGWSRNWYTPFNTTLTRTLLTNNVGTKWDLAILGGGNTGDSFSLTNQWCLTQSGISGYVGTTVSIPLS